MKTSLEYFQVMQANNREQYKPFIVNASLGIIPCNAELAEAEEILYYNKRKDAIMLYKIRHAVEVRAFERKANKVYIVSFQEHTNGDAFAVFKPFTTNKENRARLEQQNKQGETK